MSDAFSYRITPLPHVWPGKHTPEHQRVRAPFKSAPTKAMALLAREIRMLRGTSVEIAVDVEPRHLRQDGQLRADARPRSSAVIVSFSTKDGRLQFPADRFRSWEANVDAVGRALEALRMVDRYGVQQGRQYAGYKAIPAATTTTLTAHDAARTLAFFAGGDVAALLTDAHATAAAVRAAQRKTHPDSGGSAEAFRRVQAAKAVLDAHHGGAA